MRVSSSGGGAERPVRGRDLREDTGTLRLYGTVTSVRARAGQYVGFPGYSASRL